MPQLKWIVLNISSNFLGDNIVEDIVYSMSRVLSTNPHISNISLSLCNNRLKSCSLRNLNSAGLQALSLDLSSNPIDGLCLASLTGTLQSLTNLQSLYVNLALEGVLEKETTREVAKVQPNKINAER